MSDLIRELLSRSSDQDGIGWTPTTVVHVPAGLLHRAADRIAQLEAMLRAIDEQFAEAAQDDCENGVRWLNERAAEKYLYEYPHTSAAISFAKKVARAALGEERT